MASSSSSPAFSSQSWNHDVFLSFRGEDTRKTFVDHLYTALVQKGIYTYKDDETLPRGELINPSLMKAIEESQIGVIVFSENYADSSWCLDELAHIMKCKDTRGQIVIPIFYGVDPSEVRKQKQKYGEAFVKHELENKTKVESWRKALVDASNISGWEPKHIANGHESKVIIEIVEKISHRLQLVSPSTNTNLIGIASRVQSLKLKLQIGSGGVRMIGIWGVGGGGKTTLASSVYEEISRKFDGCCFLENIREKSSKKGLEELQQKILYGVLREKIVQVERVEEGKHMIKHRLCCRKVLIVLDDVDQLDQLKALAGSHDWFGEGSRIIITTRDVHVISTTAPRVDEIHNISLLNDDEAMELFCKHAPCGHKHKKDYELLSKSVVSYAGGLPLALTVLGCFLCGKDINEWRSAIARLKEIPDTNIVEKLQISFDGLTPVEKELFLDIACFFRGWYKNGRIMAMLDACGFYPVIGIKVLLEKALITISDGRFDMHDLLQEMERYIVRGEHPENPEKHSRIWKEEDVLKICAMDATKELDMIKAVRFECNSHDLVELPSVANLKNLRWIDWRGDLASPFPTNFPPENLCCLILDDISKKRLWRGYKILIEFQNLERLILRGCQRLKKIHPSIGNLERLIFLSIEFCSGLKIFPPIKQLKKLETLLLSNCPELFNLSGIQQKKNGLLHLHSNINGKEVASYKKYSSNFVITCWTCGDTKIRNPVEDLIDVEECCLEEPCLPRNNNTVLRFLPRGLRKLNLRYCNLRDKDIDSAVWEFPNLEELNLRGNKFSRLNFSRWRLPQLKWLDVSWCQLLVELWELPSSIAVVIADYCFSLESFGDISNCKWLWKVSLCGGNKLGPLVGDILLDSMLQGNALEDHFISVNLGYQMIPRGYVGRLFKGTKFTLHLPYDWYKDFYGGHLCGLAANSYIGGELVPWGSKGDEVKTTDCSELFWDKENEDGSNTFTIRQHDSKSSVEILWQPYYTHIGVTPEEKFYLARERFRSQKMKFRS
ncbi:disease resistance protein Roq1-like [Lactuca sativa]|uniref:disease resistance protein Roq1-like n=1 Tax=Lactuca sativa TaxID=4236 RepID=UPI0022AEBBD8|nr:disease resistance protein Roq1-like [Lactuca sativa]XP_052622392.1 disease resistance protein Roq1-like [Lactuca sativa]